MPASISRGIPVAGGVGLLPEDGTDLFFLSEIILQCDFAVRSFGTMLEISSSQPQSPALLGLSHALLVFAANVGKLLEPNPSAPLAMRRRSTRLRELVQAHNVDFGQIRAARNYVEHFDERMHKFTQQIGKAVVRTVTIHRIITDDELEDAVAEGKGPEPFKTRALQHLNTTTWQLNFYGSRFPIQDIVSLLGTIQKSAEKAKESLGCAPSEA